MIKKNVYDISVYSKLQQNTKLKLKLYEKRKINKCEEKSYSSLGNDNSITEGVWQSKRGLLQLHSQPIKVIEKRKPPKMRERVISQFITCVNIFFIRTPPTPCEKNSGSALDNLTTLPFFAVLCAYVTCTYAYIYIYMPPFTLIHVIPTLNGVLLYSDYQKNMIAVFSSLISCACI